LGQFCSNIFLGASPFYTKPHKGNQAIDYALKKDPPDWEIVLYLISECNADVDRAHPSTALFIAATRGEFDVCCRLVRVNAGVLVEDANGVQAIDAVIGNKDRLWILVYLIENGACVDRVKGDATPLITAVKSGKLEYVKRIVELGADVLQSCGGLVKFTAKDYSKVR
jgi:hypothetical protein